MFNNPVVLWLAEKFVPLQGKKQLNDILGRRIDSCD